MPANHSIRRNVQQHLLFWATAALSLSTQAAWSAEDKSTSKTGSCDCEGIAKLVATGGIKPEHAEKLLSYVAKHPKDSAAHFALGEYYESKKLLNPAIQEYEEADLLAPKDSRALQSQIRIRLGQKDYDAADLLTTEARKRFPNEPAIDLSKYFLLRTRGQAAAADSFLEQKLLNSASSPQLKILKAVLLLGRKKLAESLQFCNLALQQEPALFPGVILKGSILKKLGRQQEAFETVSSWFDRAPYSTMSCRFYLKFLLDEKRPNLMLEPALALLATTDPSADAEVRQSKLIAMSYLAQSTMERAEKVASKITHKLNDPSKTGQFEKSIADIYDTFGRVDLAANHYKSWLPLAPKSAANTLFVARYLETKSLDWKDALVEYETASALVDSQSRAMLTRQIFRLRQRTSKLQNDPSWALKVSLHQQWKKFTSPALATIEILRLRSEFAGSLPFVGLTSISQQSTNVQPISAYGPRLRDQVSP